MSRNASTRRNYPHADAAHRPGRAGGRPWRQNVSSRLGLSLSRELTHGEPSQGSLPSVEHVDGLECLRQLTDVTKPGRHRTESSAGPPRCSGRSALLPPHADREPKSFQLDVNLVAARYQQCEEANGRQHVTARIPVHSFLHDFPESRHLGAPPS